MTEKNTPPPEKPPEVKVRFTARHRRLVMDILGALIVVLGLITGLGLMGLTTGGVISPWAERLQRFLGWGSFLGVLFILGVGSFLVLSRFIEYHTQAVEARAAG